MLWTAVGKYSNTVLSIGVTAILTRLLTPADFGVVAMVVVISGFLATLAEAGLSTAVVQKRDLDDDALSSLFWLGLGLGVGTAALLAALAPVVALFFEEPRLTPVVALMGLGFVFIALGRVPNGLLERTFRFREIAIADVSAATLGGAIGIGGALLGAGYFALIAQTLTFALVGAVLRFYFSHFRPRRTFKFAVVRSISTYSGGVTAFSAINYWARNLDKALIGRFLGAASLGFYGRAYALMLYPVDAINGILNPTLHPVLAAVQDDRPRMAQTYVGILKVVALIALPAMAVMGALAPELVRTMWGPQWGPSVRVFSILCLVGSVQPVSSTFGAVFLATNRTKLLALVGLVNSIILMTGMSLGVRYGIGGVAIGYSIAFGVVFLPTMYIVVVVLLGGRVRDIVSVLAPAAGAAAVVLCALHGYNLLLRGRWSDLPHLLTGAVLGVAIWAACCAVIDRSVLIAILPKRRK